MSQLRRFGRHVRIDHDSRKGGMGEHGKQRDRDIELDVMGVTDSQRRDGEKQRRRKSNGAAIETRAKPGHGTCRGGAHQRCQRSRRKDVARRIDKVGVLKCLEGAEPSCGPSDQKIEPLPREQRVEIQGRVEKVVRVRVAFGEGQGAVEDWPFVHVEDAGQSETEAPQAQPESQRGNHP